MASDSAPQANPAALGLIAFGLTTVLLSLVNAGVLPASGESVVVPLAMAFGGTAQILAGMFEVKSGNTFGMTAFISYGMFWWWFALLVMLGSNGILSLKDAGPAISTALVLWGVFTLYMWVATFKLSRLLFLIFLTLWITFFLLGFAGLLGMPELHTAGGWLGLICGTLAAYGSFAIVVNSTHGKTVLPM